MVEESETDTDGPVVNGRHFTASHPVMLSFSAGRDWQTVGILLFCPDKSVNVPTELFHPIETIFNDEAISKLTKPFGEDEIKTPLLINQILL